MFDSSGRMVTSFGPSKWQNEALNCVSWSFLAVECPLVPTNAAFGRFTGAALGLLSFCRLVTSRWGRSSGGLVGAEYGLDVWRDGIDADSIGSLWLPIVPAGYRSNR